MHNPDQSSAPPFYASSGGDGGTASIDDIRAFCQRIGQMFHPRKVILFGSCARGMTTPDSDVDIAVIMETDQKPFWQSVKILQSIRRTFPVDLIVKTPEDFERRAKLGDPLILDIIEHGVVMYESVG